MAVVKVEDTHACVRVCVGACVRACVYARGRGFHLSPVIGSGVMMANK